MNKQSFKIFCILFFILLNVNAQEFTQKFNTSGYLKAKGSVFSVRFPEGWESVDGDRPNIVRKFSGIYKDYKSILMIQVKKSDVPIESECSSMSAREMVDALVGSDSNIKTSNLKKIKHESKPAFIFDINQAIQRAGLDFTVSNRIMTVCHVDKMIMLWCGAFKTDKTTNVLSSTPQDIELITPLCFQYFNSLVLIDSY